MSDISPWKRVLDLPERLVETALKMLENGESGLNELKNEFKQNSTDKEKREWEALGAVGRTHSCWFFFLILNFILYKIQKNWSKVGFQPKAVSSNFVSIYTRGIDNDWPQKIL